MQVCESAKCQCCRHPFYYTSIFEICMPCRATSNWSNSRSVECRSFEMRSGAYSSFHDISHESSQSSSSPAATVFCTVRPMHPALLHLLDNSRSLWLPTRVPEYYTAPLTLPFLRDHVRESTPCVWRSAASHCKALHLWPRNDFQYLYDAVGNAQIQVAWTPNGRADAVVNVSNENDCDGDSVFAQPCTRKHSFAEFMNLLLSRDDCAENREIPPRAVPYYSAQDSSLSKDLPRLLSDIDDSTIEFAKLAFGADPQATNLWIGDDRSVTTMHSDPFENIYLVVTGSKTFTLAPPCDAAFLHKPSLPRASWSMETEHEAKDCYQPSHAFDGWSLRKESGSTAWIDENQPSVARSTHVSVTLRPGDILYLPALWCKCFLFLLFNLVSAPSALLICFPFRFSCGRPSR